MFRQKTLFIVGAGASREAGPFIGSDKFPIGEELAKRISTLLKYRLSEKTQSPIGNEIFLGQLVNYAKKIE